jgi:hypothetical protein
MGVGAPVRGSAPDWVLGKVMTSRMEGCRPAACRGGRGRRRSRRAGGAVGQALEEEAEAVLGLLGPDAEGLEHAALDVGAVDTDAARPELVAVEDQVVGAGGGLLGGVHEGIGPLGGRGGEGMVGRVPAAGLLVPLEHGELGHPHERPAALGDLVFAGPVGGQPDPQVAQDGLGDRGAVGGQQQQVARPGAGGLQQAVALGVGEELAQGRAQACGSTATQARIPTPVPANTGPRSTSSMP